MPIPTKKNLMMAAGFVGFLLAVHLCARWLYIDVIVASQRPLDRDKAFLADPDQYDILVLGNSHPFVGIEERVLPRTVNLSDLDEGYVSNYYRLKTILERTDRKFRAVILPLSLHGFRPLSITDYYDPYRALFTDYCDLARQTGQWRSVSYAWFRYKLFPYSGCSHELIEYLRGREQIEWGAFVTRMATNWAEYPDKLGKTEVYALEHFRDGDALDPVPAAYFEAIAELCDSHGITLVLVEFPVTKLYFDYVVERLLDIERWNAFVEERLRGRDNVIRLDYKLAYGDEMFGDPLHLNKLGRIAFTEALREELESLGVLGPDSAP